jgi:hypothetical protein
MKIGFYGDSFCEEMNNPHSLINKYDTYLTKIKQHYNADIVHLGHGGSSYWDVLLKQFPSSAIPDVCIFTWTDYHRVYHPTVRNLTYGTTVNLKLKDIKLSNIFNYSTVDAAKRYFKFLYDDNKAREELISALYRFDREVLAKLTNTKIIHAWCFDNLYEWKTGYVLPVKLNELVTDGSQFAPNHLDGDERNTKLALSIINAIDAK